MCPHGSCVEKKLVEGKLAAHATSQAAGTVGLQGHCHLSFWFIAQVKDSDSHEDRNLHLFLSDSLTHLSKDVLEIVYHTVERF